MIKNILILSILFYAQFSNTSLPEPYRSIQPMPYDDHGWFSPENRKNLTQFIKEYNPKTIIELGSWLGKSVIFMAEQSASDTIVYSVDSWSPTGSPGALKDPKLATKLPTIFQQFLSNVIHKNMSHKIVPFRMDTREAARALNIIGDLIYIDASHTEDGVYHDIIDWYPHLANNGIMCGDDWHWQSVAKGVIRAAQELHQTIHTDGTFWWFDLK